MITNGWARPFVALLLVLCSMGVYLFVAMGYCTVEWKDVIQLIVGALIANLTCVVQYYFGSSKGSDDKTTILAEAFKK